MLSIVATIWQSSEVYGDEQVMMTGENNVLIQYSFNNSLL